MTVEESQIAAKRAGLVYSTDESPGIRRTLGKSGFRYLDSAGKIIRDRATLERIGALVIPPNWKDVWICTNPFGHLQVTARDDRGRKQYRYHPDYRSHREAHKYKSLLSFGKVLPRIRRRVTRDLSLRGLPRQRILATIVNLLDHTFMRIGNPEYARTNGSFGIATLRNRHIETTGTRLRFRFKGKSGQIHDLELNDRRVASVVKRCRDLPGYHLFQYIGNDGELHAVSSSDVNQYLREISGQDITAKHFRTWHGTAHALDELLQAGPASTFREAKHNVVQAVKGVAGLLGNRPATCRKYYIHPAVLDSYTEGALDRLIQPDARKANRRGLTARENRLLLLLDKLSRRRRSNAPNS